MTGSEQAKKAGFNSLTEVSNLLGTKANGQPVVSGQTLDNWSKDKPLLFAAVLEGVHISAVMQGLMT